MSLKFPSVAQVLSQFFTTFKRFPLALISAFVTAVLIIYLIEVDGPENRYFETLIKIALVSSLGVFMFSALRLISDNRSLCWLGIVTLVVYYFILPEIKDPIGIVFERHLFLSLLFFMMIFWTPYWDKNPSNEQFWEWTQSVIFALISSVIFTIFIYAGVSGAIYATKTLFSLDIHAKRYPQLFIFVSGFFGVSYFLSQLPKNPQYLKSHIYTKIETIFTKYILTPIAILYFVILYAYTFKIVLTATFPKGILAWIIIAFSVVAITAYLFWTPLWSDRGKRYKRYLSLILLLQTIMLGIAIGMRVAEYGWTHNRYMVAILGIWLFGISLYFLLFKGAKYRWLFISLSLVILISQVGPFSSYAVGEASQQERLTTLLERSKPLSQTSPIKVRYEISDMIDYLYKNYGVESLKSIIPQIVAKYQEKKRETKEKSPFSYEYFPNFATRELGFDFVNRYEFQNHDKKRPYYIYYPLSKQLNIEGFDWLVELFYDREIQEPLQPKHFANSIFKIHTTFEITPKYLIVKERNSTLAKISLKAFFSSILTDEKLRRTLDMSKLSQKIRQKLDYSYSDEKISLKLMIYQLDVDQNGAIRYIGGKLLYKRF